MVGSNVILCNSFNAVVVMQDQHNTTDRPVYLWLVCISR